MSVEALAVCLHHSKAKGTAKLILLGIANHQGDGGAWPALSTLAAYANVNQRNARKALETLRSLGEIRVDVQGGGLAAMADFERPNRYDVLVVCPPWCDRTMNHKDTRKYRNQGALPVAPDPVDKPPVECDPRSPNQGDPRSDATGDPRSDATPKPDYEPRDNQVPASTTDRARPGDGSPGRRSTPGCEPGCRLSPWHDGLCHHEPRPESVPAPDLSSVREALRQARARRELKSTARKV